MTLEAAPNVFLSWSGLRSRKMAEALHGFLRRVIQSARPFHSDKDIDSGAFWDEAIRQNLKNVRFAIVCCTPENVTAPWLNYEAGALAERLEGRTAPLLLGAKPAALEVTPISRLQAREADQAGTLHVLRSLNANLVAPLDSDLLLEGFETQWPKLEEQLKAIPQAETKAPQRTERDMLEEVVGLCRQVVRDLPKKPKLEDLARKSLALEWALANDQRPEGGNWRPSLAQRANDQQRLFLRVTERVKRILEKENQPDLWPAIMEDVAAEVVSELPYSSLTDEDADRIAQQLVEKKRGR